MYNVTAHWLRNIDLDNEEHGICSHTELPVMCLQYYSTTLNAL
jgi:hypothetical protein